MRLRSSLLFHLQLELETNVLSSGTSTLPVVVCILGGTASSEFFPVVPSYLQGHLLFVVRLHSCLFNWQILRKG